jgi:hypothetical protein
MTHRRNIFRRQNDMFELVKGAHMHTVQQHMTDELPTLPPPHALLAFWTDREVRARRVRRCCWPVAGAMPGRKHVLLSRVVWFNVLVAALALAQARDAGRWVPASAALCLGAALGNIALRLSTRRAVWVFRSAER